MTEPEIVEGAARLRRQATAPVEERDADPAEEDVVLDAELRDDAQLLVHQGDPVRLCLLRVTERELHAVEPNHSVVGPDQAHERPHEGALAGAVVPADRVTSRRGRRA